MKFIVGLILLSSLALAQEENPDVAPTTQPTKTTENAPAPEPVVAYEPEVGAPVGFEFSGDSVLLDSIKGLFLRIHTLEINNHIKEMKRDGVMGRNYVAGFTMEGAVAYDHEMWSRGLYPSDVVTGRNSGFQVVPYKLQLDTDGSVRIQLSGLAWKNMNSQMRDRDVKYCYRLDDCGFVFFDNISVASLEYNNDLARDIQEKRIRAVDVEAKVALAKSTDGRFFIAVKAGGAFGGHWSDFQNVEGKSISYSGWSAEVKYGLVINYDTSTGWRVILGTDVKHRFDWSGEEERDLTRSQWIVSPKLEVSKRLNKGGKPPIRVGAKIEANIIVKDSIHGEINADLKKLFGSGSMINGSIFTTW